MFQTCSFLNFFLYFFEYKPMLLFKLQRTLIVSTLFIFGISVSCTESLTEEIAVVDNLDLTQVPYASLSEYGFFTGKLNELNPKQGVIPFELATPLFSDYAHKKRFFILPEGDKIGYIENETFNYPIGSVLVKNFYYENDERDTSQGQRIIETRLLIHENEGWMSYGYVWNDAQTDAKLSLVGGQTEVNYTNKQGELITINYAIPNQNDCNSCHNVSGTFTPIGPKARHLNTEVNYKDGKKNQLQHWEELGLISLPESSKVPKAVVWNDPNSAPLHARAEAYLDINCGHCHRPEGSANNSGLFLYNLEKDISKKGVCKKPVAAGKGSGGLIYDIVPRNAEASILHFRMNSTQPDIMMPELGRSMIHEEGVVLIKEWINSLEEEGCQ